MPTSISDWQPRRSPKKTAIAGGDTSFLSRFRKNSVEIIHPGLGRRPMQACSCSKAIAAFSDEALQRQIINGALKAYTDRTANA